MKLGIAAYPTDTGLAPDALARAVEERGFESLFLAEHTHLPATESTRSLVETSSGEDPAPPYGRLMDLFVALSFAAAATTRLLVGSGVCLVPQREPIATAKAVASLDVLSGGRVLFGVGAGWIPEEIRNHGVDPADRWKVMGERVEAMRRIWQDDAVDFTGGFVTFGPISSWPKPLQRPHPPVLVAGDGKGVFRRVLAYGDEWMPEGRMPIEVLQTRMRELAVAAEDHGRAPIPVTVFGASPDARTLEGLVGRGVARALLKIPGGSSADDALTILDRFQNVAAQV